MKTWIALLRGINVGGNNILPMVELRANLSALGFTNVKTYIQSGNVVFESSAGSASSIADKMSNCIEESHGFRPRVLVLELDDLLAAVEANPFPEGIDEPKTLHFSFLAEPAVNADRTTMDELKSPTERYQLTEHVFYLHAPDGIGRSKLATKVEKLLGVAATARNYRTVVKLVAMAGAEKA